MGQKFLIVVDMQNDFVTGTLGSGDAVAIVPSVVNKVRNFEGTVIFTKDTHGDDYLSTQEGELLPVVHCVRGTKGWELIDELEEIRKDRGWTSYEKNTFGCIDLAADLKEKFDGGDVESVELIGVCTDICVLSNALLIKAFMPELPIYVDSSCCAGVTKQTHEAALTSMKSCQIFVK